MDDKATLLIVDDEHGPAESLRMIFKPTYHVFVARSGPEALDILRDHSIDVATLDLRMPVMSGIEVMERIKRHDPDIEVIVVTGYSSVDTAVHALRHGVFDYISKPFDVPHISDLVRRAVDRRRAALRNRQSKEDFLANVSHELRTPLNAILGYSAILIEELEGRLTELERVSLLRLQSNSYELFRLVENVLLLNELDRGDIVLARAGLDLVETVEAALRKFAPIAEEKGLHIYLEASQRPLPIVGDAAKVERVLWALIDNAVKFTHEGSITTTVGADVSGHVRVVIRDTGVGMRTLESAAALQGLTQVDASARRRFGGLGLGFRVATRLLEVLGGRLEVQSRPGEGTVVSFSLPVKPLGGFAEP